MEGIHLPEGKASVFAGCVAHHYGDGTQGFVNGSQQEI
jgi:hypothetical protein